MSARRKTKRGFTLLEMLIALVMAAVIVSPLYIITRGMAQQTEFRRMEVEALQRGRTAMNLLSRDFSRAGLFTSPNTAKDPRYLNRNVPGAAQFRAAVTHLNRRAGGQDAVLVTGNFLDSDIHRAVYVGTASFLVHSLNGKPDVCQTLFDPAFAFINVTGPKDAQMDLRVTSIAGTDPCMLTVELDPAGAGLLAIGDDVRLAANQTAIFRVENEALVRYFVAYASPTTSTGVCTTTNINGTVVQSTRRVLAENVLDFQVWFRPESPSTDVSTPDWNVPHYTQLSNITFGDGLLPPDEWQVFTEDYVTSPNVEDVGCAFADTAFIGPEQVRSAVVRLSVRTQAADFSYGAPSASDGRLIQRNLAAAPHGAAYKIKTLVTEIEMPNLAARSDL